MCIYIEHNLSDSKRCDNRKFHSRDPIQTRTWKVTVRARIGEQCSIKIIIKMFIMYTDRIMGRGSPEIWKCHMNVTTAPVPRSAGTSWD